jgi:hypothetical protein
MPALTNRTWRARHMLRYSLRSDKAQATAYGASHFVLLEGLPPPNPRIIFLNEARPESDSVEERAERGAPHPKKR